MIRTHNTNKSRNANVVVPLVVVVVVVSVQFFFVCVKIALFFLKKKTPLLNTSSSLYLLHIIDCALFDRAQHVS